MAAFCQKTIGMSKNEFPIIFSKSDLTGVGQLMYQFFLLLKKPNLPERAQVLLVTWVKLNSVNAGLSPLPCYKRDNHFIEYA